MASAQRLQVVGAVRRSALPKVQAWRGNSEDIHALRQEQILVFIASIPVRSKVSWLVCPFCGRGGAEVVASSDSFTTIGTLDRMHFQVDFRLYSVFSMRILAKMLTSWENEWISKRWKKA